MLSSVVSTDADGSESDISEEKTVDENKKTGVLEKRGHVFREKVLAVTRLVRLYKTLREQNDLIVQLKQLTPNKKIPRGLLQQGSRAIKEGTHQLWTQSPSLPLSPSPLYLHLRLHPHLYLHLHPRSPSTSPSPSPCPSQSPSLTVISAALLLSSSTMILLILMPLCVYSGIYF